MVNRVKRNLEFHSISGEAVDIVITKWCDHGPFGTHKTAMKRGKKALAWLWLFEWKRNINTSPIIKQSRNFSRKQFKTKEPFIQRDSLTWTQMGAE